MTIAVWVNGERAEQGPAVPALDHGITVGDGVFETAKVLRGEVFARTRHHDRMDRSLAGLGLAPLDRDRIDTGIDALLQEHPHELGRLRYTVTAGPGPLGSDRDDSRATYVVALQEQAPMPVSSDVVVVPWTRNERAATAGLKTTSYAENVIALAAAKELGGSEALLTNSAGALCEGTGSNLFVVVDGAVLTPSLASGPLAGITRGLVIEWLAEEGIEVHEDELPASILADADEAWLTSSIRDVQAIAHVRVSGERPTTGGGRLPAPPVQARDFGAVPGPITQRAQEIFARLAAERTNP